MLVSVTRIGSSRQIVAKAVAVVGAEPRAVHRAFRDAGLRVGIVEGTPGLTLVPAPSPWLGTPAARDAAFTELAGILGRLADITARCGGRLVPTAVGVGDRSPVLGGDQHVVEVASAVEQEVLCNLLRAHVPALIAMTGRGVTGVGRAPDRIGSRWLADSRSHLATRFLASTASEHLDRVKAELRRRDGVAQLERMDVAPGVGADGEPVVVVRCVDAAVGLAGLRANALVLAALAMRAGRRTREGGRWGNERQLLLEQNRARAVAGGLRARFVHDNSAPGRSPARARSGPERPGTAADVVRSLLGDLVLEFRGLDVRADELAPVLLAVELAEFGGRAGATETGLVRDWAMQGDAALEHGCRSALTDPEPGGVFLREMRERAPGTVAAVLRAWQERIDTASAESADARPARHGSNERGPSARGGVRDGERRQRSQQRRRPGRTDRRPHQDGDGR